MVKLRRVGVVDIVDGLRIFRVLPRSMERVPRDDEKFDAGDASLVEEDRRLTTSRVGVKTLVLD